MLLVFLREYPALKNMKFFILLFLEVIFGFWGSWFSNCFDVDPDLTFHFDADAFSDADPDPNPDSDADPDPEFYPKFYTCWKIRNFLDF